MKKLALCVVLILAFGCAPQGLQPFTDNALVEVLTDDTRVYHVRYDKIPVGFDLPARIYAVEGVQSVYQHPYEFTVTKSKAYSWREIEPKMKKVLAEFKVALEEPVEFYEEEAEEKKEGV